jgi:hypothetical protein
MEFSVLAVLTGSPEFNYFFTGGTIFGIVAFAAAMMGRILGDE